MAGEAAAVEVFVNTTALSPPEGATFSGSHAADADETTDRGILIRSAADASIGEAGAVLRAELHMTGALTQDAFGTNYVPGASLAGLSDTILISSPGLDGTTGRVAFTLDYDGDLHAEAFSGGYGTGAYGVICKGGPGCGLASPQLTITTLTELEGSQLQELTDVSGSAALGLLDFTYGVPFQYSLYLFVGGGTGGPVGATFNVHADFFHTATLGELNVYDATGARDGDAVVTSTTSDLGYAVSVPEPATWALMIAGFGAAGAGLRRRRSARA